MTFIWTGLVSKKMTNPLSRVRGIHILGSLENGEMRAGSLPQKKNLLKAPTRYTKSQFIVKISYESIST